MNETAFGRSMNSERNNNPASPADLSTKALAKVEAFGEDWACRSKLRHLME